LNYGTQARAEWRVLLSAALIGSGIGLAVGATYMAGGMAQAATEHSRSAALASAGGFSSSVLQGEASAVVNSKSDIALDEGLRGRAAAGGRLAVALNRNRELDCLTQAVYFEARGETPLGQAAVAQVVLNRVKHPAFPKTVCAVVFQGVASHGCQFSFACDGSMRRTREAGAWDRARKIAARAMSGVVLADVGSATHFHTTGVSPEWGPRMLRVSQVGLHVFYRFNPHARSFDAAPERAVFTSLPAQAMSPNAPLRIATAMVETTIDATLANAAPQAPAVQTAQPAKSLAVDAPSASAANALDLTVSSRASGEPAAS
jgi:spore germination cell wall hydrolase CwlJ-like protein